MATEFGLSETYNPMRMVILGLLSIALCAPSSRAQTTPTPQAPAEQINPKLPTIFVVGDSTANNHANGGLGWGDPFITYFDLSKTNVLNRARGGRSSRTFISEGLWDKVLSDMKAGDVVLIQFGHNDAGAINDASRARGSLPGLGEETQEIDNELTKKHEVVHTYGWYMRKMIADTKAKGATPIVLSLTVRNIWKDGRVERGSGKFSQWAAEIAKSQNVEFIDLTTIIADKYEQLGEDKVKTLFATDHTHTNPAGAGLNAEVVVAALGTFNPSLMGIYGKTVAAATVDVWPEGRMPGKGADAAETVTPSTTDNFHRITNVSRPTLSLYPAKNTGSRQPAMIVCPGGGYTYVVIDKEGTELAAWLNSIGFSALVLKYRVPQNRDGALQDLQRAISLTRANAAEWNIDPTRLGVMGFSAGGNLAAKASTLFDTRTYSRIDAIDDQSSRPDFAVLVYPAYLDKDGKLTTEVNLKAKIPPTLIVFAEDDKNYVLGGKLYHAALDAAKVSNEFLLYQNGGHGFALRSDKEPKVWPQALLAWLRKLRLP